MLHFNVLIVLISKYYQEMYYRIQSVMGDCCVRILTFSETSARAPYRK